MPDVPGPPTPPPSFLDSDRFAILTEIEPPRAPDMAHVHEQIEALLPVCDAFLVPDNHLGRATVSSVSVAHEVAYMGGRSIACMNARDRNLLGFRRDLLTSAAYGVDHFLFVYGDPPKEGRRSEDLTVRGMINEVRSFGTGHLFQGYPDFRIGTVARAWRVGSTPRCPTSASRTGSSTSSRTIPSWESISPASRSGRSRSRAGSTG